MLFNDDNADNNDENNNEVGSSKIQPMTTRHGGDNIVCGISIYIRQTDPDTNNANRKQESDYKDRHLLFFPVPKVEYYYVYG
jgi:hypothetical protein